MLEFQIPTMEDMEWVKQCLAATPHRACEYNFTNLLCWSRPYDQRILLRDGMLLTRLCSHRVGGSLWPTGSGDVQGALETLWQDARERGVPLRLVALSQEDVDLLEGLYPGRFAITSDRNSFDYCYDIEKMCELGGKKLHGKRNHINRFLESYEDAWTFEPLTKAQLAECLEMDWEWRRQSLLQLGVQPIETPAEELEVNPQAKLAENPAAETDALLAATANFEALGTMGGVLRVYGEVVAFTMGDPLTPDTFDVHFEKAYSEMQGAYAMINREFARLVRETHPQVRYLNREEDMGIPGLRRAKESYYPDLMVEKFTAVEKR